MEENKIPDYFSYKPFYEEMVKKLDNAVFVEIGLWKGGAIVYLAERIKQLNKNIKIYGIDLFNGYGDPGYYADDDCKNGKLYEACLENIKPFEDIITVIKGDSKLVYDQFEDNSIDFLFIDGDHQYEGIKRDLEVWYPKVKKGGIMAGHDYAQPTCGVKKAVDEFFDSEIFFPKKSYSVWLHLK